MSEIPDFLKKEYEASERRKNAMRNTSAYRFFDEHKMPTRIICSIAVIIAIFIGSSIHKHNYINSLYEKAIEYQEKGDYSTALYCLDKILDEDADNRKAKELYPIVEENSHRQDVENSLKRAEDYKNDGNYISAYNYAQSAYSNAEKYGYSEERAVAEQLMNELRPLKEQQEAEKAVQDKANEEARKEKRQQDIQTLVSTYVFDGELAVKILQADKGYSSGTYMYGQRSNDANGNYYPVAHKSSDGLIYWTLYNVYENGTINSNGMEEKISGYTKATGAESMSKDQKAKQEAEEKAKAEAEAKAQQEAAAKQQASSNQAQSNNTAATDKKSYMETCTDVNGGSLLRSPSGYKNKRICVTGTVTAQVTLERSKVQSALESLGIADTENLEEVIIEDSTGSVAVIYNPSSMGMRLLEGDFVSAYGEFMDLADMTSTNAFGAQSNYKIPQMRARFFD